MNNEPKNIPSLGGKARAAKLSPDERSESSSKASKARWSIQQATHEGSFKLGEIEVGCAVLQDGSRLLTQSTFMVAMGRARQAKGREYYDGDVNLPAFLTAKNLTPYITNDLKKTSSQVIFKAKNGQRAFGYPAELLPKVCEVFLKARDEMALKPSQMHIAKRAEILIRSLAQVAIVALVDEATGYQDIRARNALAEILETFIAKELQAWTSTFPLEFYKEIFRLNGWRFDPTSVKRPIVIGKWTNDIVYDRLAPGVLAELKTKNPKVDGRRKHKMFQWLTGEVAHPRLLAHLEGVKMLMKVSKTWEEFKTRINEFYPKHVTTDLGFEVQATSKPQRVIKNS